MKTWKDFSHGVRKHNIVYGLGCGTIGVKEEFFEKVLEPFFESCFDRSIPWPQQDGNHLYMGMSVIINNNLVNDFYLYKPGEIPSPAFAGGVLMRYV